MLQQKGVLFWFVQIIFFSVLAYLAFHYRRLTDFPIGDDPAAHIQTIKDFSYTGLLQTSYPLPLLVFKFFHDLTRLPHYEVFVSLISTFLLAAACMLYAFIWRVTGDWRTGAVAAVLFVVARWVNDGLRMGLLAEVFGWSVLFAALFAFSMKHKWLTIATSGLLLISHPFGFTIFALIVLMSGLVSLYRGSEDERQFVIQLFKIYGVLFLLGIVVRPGLFVGVLNFAPGDPTDWGNRTLWQIIAGDDMRRALVPFLALVGLFVALKDWEKPYIRASFFLLVIGLFLSLNHILGIGFISFRFYVYLEMGIAIFAALALVESVRLLRLPVLVSGAILLVLTAMLVLPNYKVNQEIGHWQATNPDAKAVMLPTDRAALDWIKASTKENDVIIVPARYMLWVIAYADRRHVITRPEVYDNDDYTRHLAERTESPIQGDYIYYGQGQSEPYQLAEHHRLVYTKGGVRIWRKE